MFGQEFPDQEAILVVSFVEVFGRAVIDVVHLGPAEVVVGAGPGAEDMIDVGAGSLAPEVINAVVHGLVLGGHAVALLPAAPRRGTSTTWRRFRARSAMPAGF